MYPYCWKIKILRKGSKCLKTNPHVKYGYGALANHNAICNKVTLILLTAFESWTVKMSPCGVTTYKYQLVQVFINSFLLFGFI